MSDKMAVGEYWGKYRGTVVNNLDPLRRGRLLVQVPEPLGLVPSSWAEACVPLAGPTGPAMGVYMVPPVGAGVWVEFEEGNPSYPIWVGCRWGGASDIPPIAHTAIPPSTNIVMQTLGQNSLVLSDVPGPTGGIVIRSTTGASIIVNDTGIFIQNGKGAAITLIGNVVDVNRGGLTVI